MNIHDLEPGAHLTHYKGGKYVVLFVGTHTETKEYLVAYKCNATQRIWIRPMEMFFDIVELSDGTTFPRFSLGH